MKMFSDYYEEDYDKLQKLYEAIGLTREVIDKYVAEKEV